MIVSFRDGLKFISVSVVCFCAVFVCTFFLNYYFDVLPLSSTAGEHMPLVTAQLATAKFTCGISGGVLGCIAALTAVFYTKTYINRNSKKIATFKAMGYSATEISASFTVFGLSVFCGCALGFGLGWAVMPAMYKLLTIDGLIVKINFHISLPFLLVAAPTAVFTALIFAFARIALNKPVMQILKGSDKKVKIKREHKSFMADMIWGTLRSKKALAFFVAFSAFCFSAMVQMGLSMQDYSSVEMGLIILLIGVVLALTSAVMALTSLVESNSRNLAILKAVGYSSPKRIVATFAAFIPFVAVGFALGTLYQHLLLEIMIGVVFRGVAQVPAYKFDFGCFFVTAAAFTVVFAALFAFYFHKANRVSVKEITAE